MMVDMQSINLEIEYQVLSNGAEVKDEYIVVPAANILHSAFSSVECVVANARITKPHFNYGYQAYIEDTLFNDLAYKNSILTSAYYYPDKAGLFEDYTDQAEVSANPGAKARQTAVLKSRWCQLSGHIKVPFFEADPLMLNNVPITLELYRQRPEFALIYQAELDLKLSINIRNPTLVLTRYKPAAESLEGIKLALNRKDATYFYKTVDIR
jgi:hypothetical protein